MVLHGLHGSRQGVLVDEALKAPGGFGGRLFLQNLGLEHGGDRPVRAQPGCAAYLLQRELLVLRGQRCLRNREMRVREVRVISSEPAHQPKIRGLVGIGREQAVELHEDILGVGLARGEQLL